MSPQPRCVFGGAVGVGAGEEKVVGGGLCILKTHGGEFLSQRRGFKAEQPKTCQMSITQGRECECG